MIYVLTIVHVFVCLVLIGVVLLQSGKAADLAGAFGGMGSQTAFGPRGSATLLSKLTTGSAIFFMVTSLSLVIIGMRSSNVGSSVLDKGQKPVQSQPLKTAPLPGGAPAPAPAQPGGAAPAQPGGAPPQRTITMQPEGGKAVEIPLPPPPAPGQQNQQQPATPPKK